LKRKSRIFEALDRSELDALILFNPPNIAYFSGLKLDYASILVSKEKIHAIVHVLEEERAKEAQIVDEVHAYSSYPVEGEYLRVKSLEEAVKTVILQLGLEESNIGFEGTFLPVKKYEALVKALPRAKFKDATKMIYELRMIKDEEEIFMIKKACEASIEGIMAALNAIKPDITEMDVAAEALRAMAKKGGIGDIHPIVASGNRSSLPHARASDKRISDGDFVTIDLCPQYKGYYADMTRTVVVGRATPAQRRIYQAVLEAQTAAIEKIRPGVKCKEIDEMARRILREHNYGKYFIHSTGHGLGLEIHEPPRLAGNVEDELKEGMVVTIEPGVYIPGIGGVRIEDTVLVTGNGYKILTKFAKELLEI